ncbi:cadherin-like and PC-esterase domain-containing protein 1 isoform X2 [Alosa sapidissima]|uniref:cadherin-like and PC-esterase domain-containing protein 1 isoform X2 n=1 Tax=Alosa sapidissima TaxID=34773 RepID=UPI001C08F5C4|nr:cadherin-like and PC-esterase domain-containing protein 1 isoform X2 [Alosa sapidissima]
MVRPVSSVKTLFLKAGMLLRRTWTLRRRYCTAPLLLIGIAVCLLYQMLMVDRSRYKTDGPSPQERNRSGMTFLEPEKLVSALDAFQDDKVSSKHRIGVAILLTGQLVPTATEVQLYQRVLQQHSYWVDQARYAETSSTVRQDKRDGSGWNLLVCLKGSERGCLRKISFSSLHANQRVNIIPALVEAFSEVGGVCRFQTDRRLAGLNIPIIPSACREEGPHQLNSHSLTGHDWHPSIHPPLSSANQHAVAMVNVYVLVSSVRPLSAFFHHTGLVRSRGDRYGHVAELQLFFLERLGAADSRQALAQMRRVVSDVLLAATLTNEQASSRHSCKLCFQWLTFTLSFNASLSAVVVKVQTDLHFQGLRDPGFDGQIRKELILEDGLHFLFETHRMQENVLRSVEPAQADLRQQYGGCEWTNSLCLPPDDLLLLIQFQRQLKRPGPFEVLHPQASSKSSPLHWLHLRRLKLPENSGKESELSSLFQQLLEYHQKAKMQSTDSPKSSAGLGSGQDSQDPSGGRCVDPHLRQLYTDPPLVLSPQFDPWLKEYRAEVPFDTVMVRLRPEPVSQFCHVHLDEQRGPRIVNYPVGLGNSKINILVMDESEAEPVVMTIYTLHIFRENRPSLPMFADYVMCGFVQDCGLIVRPDQPCGLEPLRGVRSSGESQAPDRPPCSSGDMPGRWVVPCLSCSDNRTCDWREVAWRPDSCYHPVLDQPQLQQCMMDRKMLFMGDSTNRGMMYYLMERVNETLQDWDKTHDTVLYHNLNHGHTPFSYSYYPQFWLEQSHRPTFQRALEQLIQRSRPLVNSQQTVLVVGGVQWLNTNHIRTVQQVLKRENLQDIMVVVKSLGMGFHLAVDGIRSLSLARVQQLDHVNRDVLTEAKHAGYEVVDTLSITMGRYKEYLQGRCACHFHEVAKPSYSAPQHSLLQMLRQDGDSGSKSGTGTGAGDQVDLQDSQWPSSNTTYHVRGPVNQVYSEILLSRLCARDRGNKTTPHR